jgi:hypothetical protein
LVGLVGLVRLLRLVGLVGNARMYVLIAGRIRRCFTCIASANLSILRYTTPLLLRAFAYLPNVTKVLL